MTHTTFRIFHPKAGGYDTDNFATFEAAMEKALQKTYTQGKLNDYWTNQDNVVEKVTTTVEVLAVIKPEHKLDSIEV